jgi:hypothetical protein
MKLILTGLLFICANLFESICLHITTKKYLNSYNYTQLIDIIFIQYNINILYLDLIAIFSFLLFIISYLITYYYNKNTYYIFTKTITIAIILSILKGIFNIVTIIPDSGGYDKCISRLGNDTVNFLINLDFNNNLFNSLIKLLKVEILGLNNKHMRYCSDMILSGHTYYVVLYNIASYDIICKNIHNIIICNIIKIILISIVIIEIILILISKFHYTVDVLFSLVIVILLYNYNYINKINNNYDYEYIEP